MRRPLRSVVAVVVLAVCLASVAPVPAGAVPVGEGVVVGDGSDARGTPTVENRTGSERVDATRSPPDQDYSVAGLRAPADVPVDGTLTVEAELRGKLNETGTTTVQYRLDLDGDGVLQVDEIVAAKPGTAPANGTGTIVFSVDLPSLDAVPATYLHGIAIPESQNAGIGQVQVVSENATDPGPIVVADRSATDPDGDARYEDVDGDGRFGVLDVAAFLDAYDERTVRGYTGAFDFDGDGRVSIQDVAVLLEEL